MTPVTVPQADWVTHQTYNEMSRLEHGPAGTTCVGEGLGTWPGLWKGPASALL